MANPVSDASLDQIFRDAHTAFGWTEESVPEVLVRAAYDLAKMGPTSANCCPARFLWLQTPAAKAQLADLALPGNAEKIRTAPWVVIIAWDEKFEDKVPELFPHNPDAKNWFADEEVHQMTALRNSTLQGAYLMLAARALGLDCGPMSGFDNAKVDALFFANNPNRANWKSNFICAIGHADPSRNFPRGPRLSFDVACEVI